ncbi:MAG: alpha/beta fold hydrolase, partial [Flavisolibacter sp.]
MRRLLFLLLIFSVEQMQAQIQSAYPPSDSGYFSSFDSTRIYYEVRGQGRPVLLIHGFIVNGSSWKRTALLNDLVDQGFKVITVDLRGNGRSGKPASEISYASDAEAKDLMLLIHYLKIKTYDAVGYSRGSIILARLL